MWGPFHSPAEGVGLVAARGQRVIGRGGFRVYFGSGVLRVTHGLTMKVHKVLSTRTG